MTSEDTTERRTLEIGKNLSLDGFVPNSGWLNCDVAFGVEINGTTGDYALLSQSTRFGFTYLGHIDTETREFRKFQPEIHTPFESTQAGGGGNKTSMYVPVSQLPLLKTLDEVLSIPGISIRS